MKLFRLLFLFLILLTACGGPPQISSAALGTVVRASKLADPKTKFAPSDHIIHLIVTVDNAAPGTTVGAKWSASDQNNRLLFEADAALDPMNTTADFALTSANDWRPGKYQVVLYLNGKPERSIDFTVE